MTYPASLVMLCLLLQGALAAATAPVPVISGSGTASGVIGYTLSYQIQASNTPTSYALASGSLPDGLSLDGISGIISGTPPLVGMTSCSVTASNGGGASVPFALTISISYPPASIPANLGAQTRSNAVLVTWTRQPQVTFAVFRRPAASSPFVPTNGGAYTAGTSYSGCLCVGTPVIAWCIDATVAASTTYLYDVFAVSPTLDYSGPATLSVTTTALSAPQLTSSAPGVASPQAGITVTITGTGIIPTAGFSPAGAVPFGSIPILYQATPMTWEQAETQAEGQGGWLATVQSSAENTFLQGVAASNPCWIGLWDPTGIGSFGWVDGEAFSYANWLSSEPNNIGYEIYCQMYADGSWNNLAASGGSLPSLIAFPPIPSAPALVVLRRVGQTDIPATTISSTNAQTLSCTFNLVGAVHGAWDVVVTNPDGGTASVIGGLEIDTPPVAGPIGCIHFNGSTDLAITADDPLLAITTQQTLEGWFRTTSTSSQAIIMAQIASSPLYAGLDITLGSGLLNAGGYTGPGWLSNFTQTTVNDGTWHHVALVIDNLSTTTYVDGVATGPLNGGGTFNSTIAQIVFGGHPNGYLCAGDIGGVRSWTAALPGSVIAAWRGARATSAHPYWSSLQADFHTDDGSNGYALDSVHGINAFFTGTPHWSSGLMYASGLEDVPVTGTLTGSDVDGDTVTYSIATPPSAGMVVVNAATGAYAYTPTPGMTGFDRFTYQVNDGFVSSPVVQVNLYIAPNPALLTPTVTWSTPAAISYGTPLGAQQLNASSAVPGVYAYTPPAGTVLNVGSPPLSVVFTPTDVATYQPTTVGVSQTVVPAMLTISAVSLATTAGTIPTFSFVTSGLVTGDHLSSVQLATTANAASPPGIYPITPSAAVFGSGSAANYSIAYQVGMLTVAAAPSGLISPVITWPNPAAIVYGTPLGTLQLTATANAPGTFTYTPAATSVLAAGAESLTVLFTPANPAVYTSATATVPLTVLSAPLTVTANDAAMITGTAVPALTASFTGFVAGDSPGSMSAQPIVSTTATASSPPGTYPISVSGASDANYTITYVPGVMTVSPESGTGTTSDSTSSGGNCGLGGGGVAAIGLVLLALRGAFASSMRTCRAARALASDETVIRRG